MEKLQEIYTLALYVQNDIKHRTEFIKDVKDYYMKKTYNIISGIKDFFNVIIKNNDIMLDENVMLCNRMHYDYTFYNLENLMDLYIRLHKTYGDIFINYFDAVTSILKFCLNDIRKFIIKIDVLVFKKNIN